MILPQLAVLDVEQMACEPGEVLIEEGTPGNVVYVLSEGELAVSLGRREVCRVAEPGALFGEMSALLGKCRTATVSVTQPSTLYVIDDLLAFLRHNPEIAILLLKTMAQRVENTNEHLRETQAKKWWQFL